MGLTAFATVCNTKGTGQPKGHTMEIQVGKLIKGFYYGKDFYDVTGTVKAIKKQEKKRTAIILNSDNKDTITWVTSVVYV